MDVQDFLWNSPVAGLLFCVAIAVVIFLVFIGVEKKFFPKKKSPKIVYIRVPGKLVKIKRKYSFLKGLYTIYIFRFTTEGEDIIEAGRMPGLMDMTYMREGANVKICYNPNNPYDFFVQ